MSITEVIGATGSWSVKLKSDTPMDILNLIDYYGHIAIHSGRINVEEVGDNLLRSARYVGPCRGRNFGDENKGMSGTGMAMWLGDEDKKGYFIEEPIVFTDSTYTNAFTTLLPPTVAPGNIEAITGLYNQTHQYQSPRQALDYLSSIFDGEYRVNGDGTVDAGTPSFLYVTEPKTAILRRKSGQEMRFRALPGRSALDSDINDFSTRVVMLKDDPDLGPQVTATKDILPGLNPYKDLFGNPIKMTRVIEESQSDGTNADARAQLQLNRFTSPRDAVKLSTQLYDIKGDLVPGDYVWVYDSEAKLQDLEAEEYFYGELIHPLTLRVFEMTWPIEKGMTVGFRNGAGVWVDLTPYVEFEQGDVSVVVGGYNRSLTGSGSTTDPIGSVPTTNSTIPDEVQWGEFQTSTYQAVDTGETKAQITLNWNQPLNTDGSVIQDGFQYEIRWRTSSTSVYEYTHQDLSFFTHAAMVGTFGAPVPFIQGAWQYTSVSFDVNSFLLLDLTPGIPYDFQIRLLDNAKPANVSVWSDVKSMQTRPDTIAPSAPAAPEVAASRIAFQIVHRLGRASGGIYDLEADLNHLQIHAGNDPLFLPVKLGIDEGGTLIGKLIANQGMMRGLIPAVGTFQVESTEAMWVKVVAVDNFGNESTPSEAVQQTADLIDDAHISDLTVSKVTAGTIMADWLLGATIATAESGARVEIGYFGIDVFNVENIKTLEIDSETGNISMIGTMMTGPVASRIVIGDFGFPTIRFYSNPLNKWAFINSFDDTDSNIGLGLNSAISDDLNYRAITYMRPTNINSVIVGANGPDGYPDQYARGGAHSIDKDFVDGRIVSNDPADPQVDGGMYRLRRAGTGRSFIGRREPTTGLEARIDFDDQTDNQISMNVGTKIAARFRTVSNIGIVESSRFADFGNAAFRGRVAGQSGTFAMRDDGAANGILDMDGKDPVYVKNFVIEHPSDKDRYLVHACTETPEAAVEYSGTAFSGEWGELIEVVLPSYFEDECEVENRQVWLQPMLNPDSDLLPFMPRALPSYPKDGKFYITNDCAHPGVAINWKVKAVRKDVPQFPVEPLKSEYNRVGSGPYTWLEEK